jgi:hypothetical protein
MNSAITLMTSHNTEGNDGDNHNRWAGRGGAVGAIIWRVTVCLDLHCLVEHDGGGEWVVCCRSRLNIWTEFGRARCAFSNRILHSRMPLDPTHVRFKQTCVWQMALLSGIHSSYRLAR